MVSIKELTVDGYKRVIEATDNETKLHCIIAIHNTSLGPSLGGTRIFPYSSSKDALNDVLQLAKAMTYKSAVAELGTGGGKSVIIADPIHQKNENLLRAFGKVVDYLKGDYIAAEDVGTCPEDMAIIRQTTPYVAALPCKSSSGDPSRFTAWGIFRGIQATAKKLWGSPSIANKKILVQGLGHVGGKLAQILFWEGANLVLSERDPIKLQEYAALLGAETVELNDYASTECDIFAPCAMGNVITEENVSRLRCQGVAGGANNQLTTPAVGQQLFDRGIVYAPDYVINAGGLINATAEFNNGGYDPVASRNKVNTIYDILLNLFNQSEKSQKPTNLVADEIAEHNLKHLIGKRTNSINFQR